MSKQVTETTASDSVAVPASSLVRQFAQTLKENNLPLLHRVIAVLGAERAQAFLRETLELEAQGGTKTRNGDRNRTPGGSFFYLIRQAITRAEYKQIWPRLHKKASPSREGATPPSPTPVAMTWEQAVAFVQQAKAQPGEAKTVKLTLVGRPLKIIQQTDCVILSMKGKEPGSFPKGLPAPPANSAITWAVFIAAKQWAKVAPSIANEPEDNLIVEGYPLLKDGVAVVLAQSCKSMLQEKAAKAKKADL